MGSLPIVFGRKNLGNVTKVFVNDSFGIVARTIWFCFPNSLVRISPGKMGQGNPYQRVRETKPKSLGNNLEGIIYEDLGFISQIFLPKMTGNDPMPCCFVYVIAPQVWAKIYPPFSYQERCITKKLIFMLSVIGDKISQRKEGKLYELQNVQIST